MATKKHALIIDDEPDIRELLEITLGRMDIETSCAENVKQAKQLLAAHKQDAPFDFCLSDMQLPDGNGIELVKHIQCHYPHIPVAMITAHGTMDTAVDALKAGAFDFVSKPVNLQQLRTLVDSALKIGENPSTHGEGLALDNDSPGDSLSRLLGESHTMGQLRKQIAKLARSKAPIYISGESGSGKELVARLIHDQGPNKSAPFIPVNCGAIPSELMESEFFGHTKGSFTGALADKEGLFQAASGGTLFLDEVADLPLAMQVKLLRAIQEKAIRAIGSRQEVSIDVRILSATHKDLAKEVDAGRFRQDLYYRINVIELQVPSLRDRKDDIPMLAQVLLRRVTDDRYQPPTISQSAMRALLHYPFPGNVRELENILERAYTLCENDIIKATDLGLPQGSEWIEAAADDVSAESVMASSHQEQQDWPQPSEYTDKSNKEDSKQDSHTQDPPLSFNEDNTLEDYLEDIEKKAIVDALESTRWNKTAAAKKLGISFRALRYRLKKLDLE